MPFRYRVQLGTPLAPKPNPVRYVGVAARKHGLVPSILLACLSFCVQAQQSEDVDSGSNYTSKRLIEEIITIGTRQKERIATETPVPVDVFSAEEIESINSSDLVDVLNTMVPSFNVTRQPISDGATFVRPTSLRGLDTHHTLVLVNGKRRHRSALVQLFGFGSHGPDVGNFPSSAIRSVEVLRDGAAAQYGSDAIAGVINFNLKADQSSRTLVTRYGGYSQGDGEEVTVEANIGFALGTSGFLILSTQYSDSAQTNRSQLWDIPIGESSQTPFEAMNNLVTIDGVTYYGPDAFSYRYAEDGTILQVLPVSDGIPDDLDTRYRDNYPRIGGPREFDSPEQIWGQPRRSQLVSVVNAGMPLSDSLELYGFGNFAERDQGGGFFYRRAGVSQLLPLRLEDGSIYDPRTELYPSGFTPFFSSISTDYSGTLGIRREPSVGLSMDFSLSYGNHELDYRIENTMNPSLGPTTPKEFHPGKLVSDELALNADFTRDLDLGFSNPLSLAFGFEWRDEGYQIEAGDVDSWTVGPFATPDPFNFEITQAEVDADPNDDLTVIECRIPGFLVQGALCPQGDPIHNVVPVGSNGFPGYSPQFTSNVNRQSQAGYLEFELDLTEDWLVNAATRFEKFSDFGNVAIAKLAMFYDLSESLSLRGSIGTGFRAPTPGQISTTNVSTRINARGFPVAEGIFPAEHAASIIFGAEPLDSEDSRSLTMGLVAQPLDSISITFDYYRIRVDHRIILSSQFDVGPSEVALLEKLGVPGANSIALVRFFTNDVDSSTSGVDLVATWNGTWLEAASTLQFAINKNNSELTGRGRFIDDESDHDLRNGAPNARAVISLFQDWERWNLMIRGSYYGKYSNAATSALDRIQHFSSKLFVDLEVSRSVTDRLSVKFGSQNLFDSYPDKGEFEACCGRIYRSDSLMPWQGTSYYVQLRWADI